MLSQPNELRAPLPDPVRSKQRLLILASHSTRAAPDSPLLRFVRDYVSVLRKFDIHATGGTARSILATGLFNQNEIVCERSGPDGGVVTLAAYVARQEAIAVIHLSDPRDWESNVPENYALQRVCKELKTRLITTLAGAERWAENEAMEYASRTLSPPPDFWKPPNFRDGIPNVSADGRSLNMPLERQSIALIAHDNLKGEMVEFVNCHTDCLVRFDRILTTGTTGYFIKLLFAEDAQYESIKDEANRRMNNPARLKGILKDVWVERMERTGPYNAVKERAISEIGREQVADIIKSREMRISNTSKDALVPRPDLVEKVMPLTSGPKGGDILIADEVLNNRCHAVAFFHDPGTSHAHSPDIHLFERTCQFWPTSPRVAPVYATCVGDPESARTWATSLRGNSQSRNPDVALASRLREIEEFGLRDVVIVPMDRDEESDELGNGLARACAAYFHKSLISRSFVQDRISVGTAWGWGTHAVLNQLKMLESDGLISKRAIEAELRWMPLVGNLSSFVNALEASMLAEAYAKYYGGSSLAFAASGIVGAERIKDIPDKDRRLMEQLRDANFVIASAARWDAKASLATSTALKREAFPAFEAAVGMICSVFFDENGKEVTGDHQGVGLDYAGLQAVATNGTVLLMCGGEKRRRTALAALRARLASVLFTTEATAKWLLESC